MTRQDTDISSFNKVLGRKESKKCKHCGGIHNPGEYCTKTRKLPQRNSEDLVYKNKINDWLAGKQRESKKVFSFKTPVRTFGFVNPTYKIDFNEMKKRLKSKNVWNNFSDEEFLEGSAILKALFGEDARS